MTCHNHVGRCFQNGTNGFIDILGFTNLIACASKFIMEKSTHISIALDNQHNRPVNHNCLSVSDATAVASLRYARNPYE